MYFQATDHQKKDANFKGEFVITMYSKCHQLPEAITYLEKYKVFPCYIDVMYGTVNICMAELIQHEIMWAYSEGSGVLEPPARALTMSSINCGSTTGFWDSRAQITWHIHKCHTAHTLFAPCSLIKYVKTSFSFPCTTIWKMVEKYWENKLWSEINKLWFLETLHLDKLSHSYLR